MLVFNCTKSAAAFLSPRKSKDTVPLIQPVPKFGMDEVGTSEAPISQWLIQHTVQLDHDILYVCHVQHRFTMVFTEVEKGNWLSFMECFWNRIVNHLCYLVDEIPLKLNTTPHDWLHNIRMAHSSIKTPIFCQRYNPSVGASVTRFRQHFDQALYDIGCVPSHDEAGAFEISENSRMHYSGSKNEMFFPAYEFLSDCLNTYMGVTSKELPSFKSLSLDYFEQGFKTMFEKPELDQDTVIELLGSLIGRLAEDNKKRAKKDKVKQKKRPANVVELKSKK